MPGTEDLEKQGVKLLDREALQETKARLDTDGALMVDPTVSMHHRTGSNDVQGPGATPPQSVSPVMSPAHPRFGMSSVSLSLESIQRETGMRETAYQEYFKNALLPERVFDDPLIRKARHRAFLFEFVEYKCKILSNLESTTNIAEVGALLEGFNTQLNAMQQSFEMHPEQVSSKEMQFGKIVAQRDRIKNMHQKHSAIMRDLENNFFKEVPLPENAGTKSRKNLLEVWENHKLYQEQLGVLVKQLDEAVEKATKMATEYQQRSLQKQSAAIEFGRRIRVIPQRAWLIEAEAMSQEWALLRKNAEQPSESRLSMINTLGALAIRQGQFLDRFQSFCIVPGDTAIHVAYTGIERDKKSANELKLKLEQEESQIKAAADGVVGADAKKPYLERMEEAYRNTALGRLETAKRERERSEAEEERRMAAELKALETEDERTLGLLRQTVAQKDQLVQALQMEIKEVTGALDVANAPVLSLESSSGSAETGGEEGETGSVEDASTTKANKTEKAELGAKLAQLQVSLLVMTKEKTEAELSMAEAEKEIAAAKEKRELEAKNRAEAIQAKNLETLCLPYHRLLQEQPLALQSWLQEMEKCLSLNGLSKNDLHAVQDEILFIQEILKLLRVRIQQNERYLKTRTEALARLNETPVLNERVASLRVALENEETGQKHLQEKYEVAQTLCSELQTLESSLKDKLKSLVEPLRELQNAISLEVLKIKQEALNHIVAVYNREFIQLRSKGSLSGLRGLQEKIQKEFNAWAAFYKRCYENYEEQQKIAVGLPNTQVREIEQYFEPYRQTLIETERVLCRDLSSSSTFLYSELLLRKLLSKVNAAIECCKRVEDVSEAELLPYVKLLREQLEATGINHSADEYGRAQFAAFKAHLTRLAKEQDANHALILQREHALFKAAQAVQVQVKIENLIADEALFKEAVDNFTQKSGVKQTELNIDDATLQKMCSELNEQRAEQQSSIFEQKISQLSQEHAVEKDKVLKEAINTLCAVDQKCRSEFANNRMLNIYEYGRQRAQRVVSTTKKHRVQEGLR